MARAFTWNLGRVTPSPSESERLAAEGLTDPTAQRYAVWRRSLLLVAAAVSGVAFALAAVDVATGGMGECTTFGKGLEAAWRVGAARWAKPKSGAALLVAAWAATFLLPEEIGLEDVQTAMAESKSVVYAFDLGSFRLAIDFLAKRLVVTAVFADLALRATLIAWRNDRSLRGNGDTAYDASAAALGAALGGADESQL